MWRQRRFCGRHFVHKKRLLKYFQRSVRWVNCKLAMAVLTKRNIQEFKDKGFTQASYCILSSGQFGKYGYRSKTFRLIQFCKIEARNNRGYGITNSYPKKWWSFLDALASLDFKLSVGQSVTYRFSDSKASASVGRLSIYFLPRRLCLAGERQAQEGAPQGVSNSHFRRRLILLIFSILREVTVRTMSNSQVGCN